MTKFLDLDAVHQDLAGVAVKIAGEVHKLKPLTVLEFIANTKLMQELRAGATDMAKEFEATIVMVGRSFPTVPVEHLKALSMVQLNKLVAFARDVNNGPSETPAAEAAPSTEAPKAAEVAAIGSENPPAAQ